MDLKQLSYFVSVYEQGSFNKASKTCFVAQPSISSAIAQLEMQLEGPLFNRHARGVTPTSAGKKLYPLAKKLLGQAKAIETSFKHSQEKQIFRLGVTKGLGVKRMSLLLKNFISKEPNMELTLVPPLETSDARIIIKEELELTEQYQTIWQEDYLLALPLDHPLAFKDSITLEELDGLDVIQRTPCSAWDRLNDTLTLSGLQLSIRAKIQTIDYALGLVKAGLGAALLPAHKELIEQTDVCFKPLKSLSLNRQIVLAYKSETPVLNSLINCVKAQASYKN